MALNYLVYGVDRKGNRTQVATTPSARAARTFRDAGNSPWVETIVYGADGPLTRADLDRLAQLEQRLADGK